ncbi:hypothetical protein BN946_scf185008.g55 [Trametes cinnabarina]|uniref:C3H1-type domain-containing protein n=1 Tax=Pycnoporus cinnabarinus TaxID=5643 RepID=A0A060SLL4_PYCCI|nr:hypothetical protein BN946_scf185008.g55 [Trametes cinnabarina]
MAYSCIKNWRGNEGKSDDIIQAGTTKTCPMCRTSSRFVTPSAYYYPEGHPRKSEVIEKYKASMARVKCKYFERSKPSKRFCPFGKDCFYKHENADGTPFVFEHGASHYMNRGPSRRSRDDIDWETESDAGFEFMLNTISQVLGGSQDMRTALRAVASAFSVDFQPLPYDGPDTVSEEDSDEGEGEGDEEEEDEPYMPLALLASNGADAEVDGAAMEEIPAASDGHSEDHGGDAPMHAARSIFDLDPTIPEFVPSFQLNLRTSRNAASPSYLYDRLRPLPHNPILAVHHEYEGGIERTSTETRSSLRELEERLASDLEQAGAMDQQTSGIDLTSLLLASPTQSPYIDNPSSLATESPDVTLPEALPEHFEEPPAGPQFEVESAFLQDTDPPFMTDGRGRVVWSNATSSRGCEGRRVRAASSSIVHPHIVKPNADLLAAGDDHASPSNHGSPMHHPSQLPQQQLVRRRSLPSVSTSTPIEDKRSAEFITDGRGRVVFASNNQSH